jgi:primosomal protein N' (replication factor Y)
VSAPDRPAGPVVRVLPDEGAIDKTFDYLVPSSWGDQVRVGDRVRIALAGRRVGGWVVAVGVSPPEGVALRPLAKWSGRGPGQELIDLAEWAAWRWAGRRASFLRTASPDRTVRGLPAPPRPRPVPTAGDGAPERHLPEGAFASPRTVLRLPPAVDPAPVALAAARRGNALVLCPTAALARAVATHLRRAGVAVARHPEDWAVGAAGATVVGTRAAAWAPVAGLAAVVIVDEHDESHQQEQAPTWHARDVAAERARRAGVPCVLTSPCPSLEALGWGRLMAPSRADERAGWPVVDAVDMRREDPRTGLLTPALVRLLRSDRRVLCVLNRTGRARLLACAACGELARCERCDAALAQPSPTELVCPRCATVRPVVCAACGAARFKALRQGVTRVRDEIEALVREPVDEVTAARPAGGGPASRVVVGTEATLHQIDRADVVAFLDADQELLAPRYRAAEQALALLARAARLVGGKAGGGRIVVQTFVPRHEVVQAALHGDPARATRSERARRELLRFPPVTAMAEVSGVAAPAFVEALQGGLAGIRRGRAGPGAGPGDSPGVEMLGPSDGRWLVRAPDHGALCDALAATARPPGRLRVAVDPPRV